MKFDVLNRFTGKVQFTAEIECDETAAQSVKLGLAVKWAVMSGASLDGASLNGASLDRASFDGASFDGASLNRASLNRASLNWASLNGASLDGINGINKYIKCLHLEDWPITYTFERMQIGCQNHAIEEWKDFDDRRIIEMDGMNALKFWRKFKDHIFATIELCPAQDTGAHEIETA